MLRYSIPLVIFLLLVVLFVAGLQYDPRRVPSPLIDKPLPEFKLPRLGEPKSTLSSIDLRGRVVLLNVWASWCVACRHEHPLLVELSKSDAVEIYGLNYKDRREDALAWLQKFGDPYLASAFDQDGRTGIDLGVYGVPESYIVDEEGVIRYKHIGPITWEDMHNIIFPLLDKLKQSAAMAGTDLMSAKTQPR